MFFLNKRACITFILIFTLFSATLDYLSSFGIVKVTSLKYLPYLVVILFLVFNRSQAARVQVFLAFSLIFYSLVSSITQGGAYFGLLSDILLTFSNLLLFIFVSQCISEEDNKKVARTIIFIGVISSVLGIAELLFGHQFEAYSAIRMFILDNGYGYFDSRSFSFYFNPNFFGLILVICFILGVEYKVKRHYLVVIFLGLLTSKSKTALALVTIFLYLYFLYKYSKPVLFFSLFFFPSLFYIGYSVLDHKAIFNSLLLRVETWSDLELSKYLFLGRGFGYSDDLTFDNGYLRLSYSLGIIGMLIYFSIYLISGKSKYTFSCVVLFVVYLLSNITIPSYYIYPLSVNFNIALALLISRKKNETIHNNINI
ncbi:membrane hypothetical protein [Vibrio parahaemolyticus]